MDAFDFFGNVKPKAMRRDSLFHTIAKALRILELCFSLLLLYWILSRLSFALQISGDYFRRLSAFIGSPLFVFIISNAIIATLLANSRRIIAQNSEGDNAESLLYRELVKKTADPSKSPSPSASQVHTDQSRVAEEVEYQDKQMTSDINTTACTRALGDQAEMDTCRDKHPIAESQSEFPKVYRRSHSENLTEQSGKVARQKLRRSETAKYGESSKSGENPREILYPQDKLSNEEFQRTIEAFIARQMRFLREESLAIVVQKQS